MATKNLLQQHKDNWKKTDTQTTKQKRINNLIRLRKEKRFDSLKQIRLENDSITDRSQTRELINYILSSDPVKQLECLTKLRKILSATGNPPFKEVIDSGVIPRLVEFLTMDNQQLQFESCWALSNIIGSSEKINGIIEANAVPRFKQLLYSPHEEVREQAAWAIGNIAADSVQNRDYVLVQGILEPLLQLSEATNNIKTLKRVTWTISNLCRNKPQPQWGIVSKAIPTLTKLMHHTDDDILSDACWALTYLSDGPNERIQAILDTNIAPRIAELLLHDSYNVQTPALRMVGNIVTGDDTQTQVIINAGVLPNLMILLDSSKKQLRKEACWVISNITAGTRQQVEAVISAQIIPRLIYLLKNSEFDIKKEAAWALSNATTCGSVEQIKYLVEQNIIEPMCELLNISDHKIILVGLEALDNILKVGESDPFNPYANQIEECSGLDRLEVLQNHNHKDVYEKATNMLETYFEAEEEERLDFPFGKYSAEHFNF